MAPQRVNRRGHRLEADHRLVGRREDLPVVVEGRQLDRQTAAAARNREARARLDREEVVERALAERERLRGQIGRRAGREAARVERERGPGGKTARSSRCAAKSSSAVSDEACWAVPGNLIRMG